MNNLIRVQFVDRLADLPHNVGYFLFRHGLEFFELLEKLASCCDLHQKINIDGVIEKPVHSYDIWVIQIALNFEFSDKLLCDFLLPKKLFLNYLDGANKLCFFLTGKKHVAILADP